MERIVAASINEGESHFRRRGDAFDNLVDRQAIAPEHGIGGCAHVGRGRHEVVTRAQIAAGEGEAVAGEIKQRDVRALLLGGETGQGRVELSEIGVFDLHDIEAQFPKASVFDADLVGLARTAFG